MNDAESMRFFEHVADLRGDADALVGVKSSFTREHLRQSVAFDELHHDEVTAVRKIARVEDHRGVLMAQLGHRARFTQKSLGDVGIAGKLALDDLDCYWTFETQVSGEIDSTHAAGPDFAFDPEPARDVLGDIHI